MSDNAFGYFDFIFDIVFITAIVHVSFGVYSYMTLFYLFPIFISSIAIKNKQIYLVPAIAVLFYGAVYVIHGVVLERESLLSISLHAFSFFLIAFAGNGSE